MSKNKIMLEQRLTDISKTICRMYDLIDVYGSSKLMKKRYYTMNLMLLLKKLIKHELKLKARL